MNDCRRVILAPNDVVVDRRALEELSRWLSNALETMRDLENRQEWLRLAGYGSATVILAERDVRLLLKYARTTP